VDILVFVEGPLVDKVLACTLLQEWMQAEAKEYYRVHFAGGETLFYDVSTGQGLFWSRSRPGEETELREIVCARGNWEPSLTRLRQQASQADAAVRRVLTQRAQQAA